MTIMFPSSEGRGLELRNNLRRLLGYRRTAGMPIGSASGWARAAAYLSRLLDEDISAQSVMRRVGEIGLTEADVARKFVLVAADEVASGRFAVSGSQIASDLGVTAAERDAIGRRKMRCIPPADIEPHEYRKQQARERAASKRKLDPRYTPRENSAEATKPWEALGISRRTYYRKQRGTETSRCSISSKEEGWRDETVPSVGERDELVPVATERKRGAA